MKQRVYMVRPASCNEWLVCQTHQQLMEQIDEIANEDEVSNVEIRVKMMAPAEIEALPEFGGW